MAVQIHEEDLKSIENILKDYFCDNLVQTMMKMFIYCDLENPDVNTMCDKHKFIILTYVIV